MATQAQRDYYEILSVACTATQQEIKSAFLRLAVEYQAGKPANIEAVERFRQIARAFRVLNDADQRRRYDQLGENGVIIQPLSSGYDLERWPIADPETAEKAEELAGVISMLCGF